MNNFERITASPEALGDFLGALPILSGPWDDDFHRVFCDSCDAENCDAENRFQCWRIAAYKKFTRRWGSVPCAPQTGQRIARTQKLRLSENTGSLFFQKKLPGRSAYCSTRQRKTRLCAMQL